MACHPMDLCMNCRKGPLIQKKETKKIRGAYGRTSGVHPMRGAQRTCRVYLLIFHAPTGRTVGPGNLAVCTGQSKHGSCTQISISIIIIIIIIIYGPTPWGLICHIRMHICEIGSLHLTHPITTRSSEQRRGALGEQFGVKLLLKDMLRYICPGRDSCPHNQRASGSVGMRPNHSAIPL